MSKQPRIVTGLGKAELHRILVCGYDLNEELVGKITFSQMAFLLLLGRLPGPGEVRMTDALLTILVEHGMVSSAVTARLTYHTAPEAIQGAVAAAILGAGSVHLGSSEWSAKMLQEALPRETKEVDFDALAASVVNRYDERKQRLPGIGHRTHAEGDPRANRLFQIARDSEVYGRYCQLLEHISKAAEQKHGRRLPINVTGAIAATALDMGLPWQITKAFALIGRTLGALAHIAEEMRNPMARNIDAAIKPNLVYEPYRTERKP
ncbi:MAG: citryl-CoA lyase [Deltaproteobacteria bacterium]|nr:citryl-CoA lyase [Deltaproteobacteria bacterium]